VIKRAYYLKAPNIIAEDVYQLSTSFSKFYNDFHILKETDQEKRTSWIHLCIILKKYLELELDLLGITSVESM
jgi:arginyl-tRNA synthetase